ncbi:MAG: ATP-binding protein [Candidatus Magasanikbacteria bacterium]|nr:ATP-binding protein [Candidatus Magasanikbacteria bacterium]
MYCIDNALAKALGFAFYGNQGRMLENLIFLELKRHGFELYYYRSKDDQEVDFVAKKNTQLHLFQGTVAECAFVTKFPDFWTKLLNTF